MPKFTLLTTEQLNNSKLFETTKTKTFSTDFAKLLGIDIYSNYKSYFWLKRNKHEVDVREDRGVGIRPVLPYSTIKKYMKENVFNIYEDYLEVECFSYPQNVVNSDISKKLEKEFFNRTLIKTGNTYTVWNYETEEHFPMEYIIKKNTIKFIEYSYNGEIYIRFVTNDGVYYQQLSDGKTISSNKAYWIKVEPITFLVDKNLDFAITKDIILSGIIYSKKDNIPFEYTEINKYLKNVLSFDVISSKDYNLSSKKYLFSKKDNEEKEEIEETLEKKEYTNGINKEENIKLQIELCGSKKDIVELLKKIKDDAVEINLLENKKNKRFRK